MSSILTNASAMAALQTMRSINDQMDTTQNRISSGYRVDTASDNAAYWSIATTMRSDNAAMSTVSDALGLGSAQVDVAYTAMESVKDTLDEIKTKLVAAQQPDVDKSKIQSEIKQLQADLKTFAESATFSGGNWLSVGAEGAETQKIVASFLRDESGSISLGTIDVDTSKTALFNEAAGGILEQAISIPSYTVGDLTITAGDAATAVDEEITSVVTGLDGLSLAADESFSVTVDGTEYTVDATAAMDAAGIASALETQLGTDFTAAFDDAAGSLTITKTAGTAAGDTLAVSGIEVAAADVAFNADGAVNVSNFEISNDTTSAELSAYLQATEEALSSVTSAAADLGAIKTRVGSQQDFVSKLMDAVDRGVGALVDADMNEESTRLKALQTQQQLGIQALSIANSNSQNILSLFR